MDVLITGPFAPFTAALIGLALLALFEVAGLLLSGAGVSELVEMALDTDTFPESSLLNWTRVDGLPLAVALSLVLAGFGMSGVLLQGMSVALQDSYLSLWLAIPAAVVLSLLFLRKGGRVVAPLFRTQTTAVSESTLLGRNATLLSPTARLDFAGEAIVRDEFGQPHYVMVEPAEAGNTFTAGQEIQLVGRKGSFFTAKSL